MKGKSLMTHPKSICSQELWVDLSNWGLYMWRVFIFPEELWRELLPDVQLLLQGKKKRNREKKEKKKKKVVTTVKAAAR